MKKSKASISSYCSRLVSGITFIRYVKTQKIGKINDIKSVVFYGVFYLDYNSKMINIDGYKLDRTYLVYHLNFFIFYFFFIYLFFNSQDFTIPCTLPPD